MGRLGRFHAICIGVGAVAISCGGTPAAKQAAETKPAATRNAPSSEGAVTPAPAVTLPPPARPEVRLGTVWVMRGSESSKATEEAAGVIGGSIGHGGSGGFGVGTIGVGGVGIRRRPVPTVTPGNPTVRGGLDRAIVRRIIRHRLYSLRSCYQQQLRIKPHLVGTVWVRFLINPQGRVVQAKATGMDKAVATCIERVLRYVRFPKPKGSGMVQITYPFRFSNAPGGFSPLAPPPAPPPPTPHARPRKPRPIPLTESPVLKRDPEPEVGATMCHVSPRPVGIDAIIPAATVCYEQLLDRKPSWVGRMHVRVSLDGSGSVVASAAAGSAADDGFAACLSSAGRALVLSGAAADELREHTLVLPLSFDKQGGEPLPTTRVSVTDHDLRIGLRLVASELAWARMNELTRIAWKTVFDEARASGGRTVLRVDDEVDAGVVVGAVAEYGKHATSLRFARHLGDNRWKIVNPLGSSRGHGVCDGKLVAPSVGVRLDREGIWIGTDKGHIRIANVDGEHDVLGYARALRSLRRNDSAPRSDLDISVVMPGVPYGVFVRVLEIAIESGFHDASVRPLRSIRDPRRQPRRQ